MKLDPSKSKEYAREIFSDITELLRVDSAGIMHLQGKEFLALDGTIWHPEFGDIVFKLDINQAEFAKAKDDEK